MTYLELIESANLKFETNKVTLGEYERMIEPLKREIQPAVQPDHTADVSKKVSISCGQENDLISRQAARHALCKAVHKGEDIPCENQTASCLWTGTRVCDYVREIDALPTVQPETATVTIGRTKGGVVMRYECDACGESINQKDCYCRNCGRKLMLPESYRGGDSNEQD